MFSQIGQDNIILLLVYYRQIVMKMSVSIIENWIEWIFYDGDRQTCFAIQVTLKTRYKTPLRFYPVSSSEEVWTALHSYFNFKCIQKVEPIEVPLVLCLFVMVEVVATVIERIEMWKTWLILNYLFACKLIGQSANQSFH